MKTIRARVRDIAVNTLTPDKDTVIHFVDNMVEYIGKTITVKRVCNTNTYTHDGWIWHKDWLDFSVPKEKIMKARVLYIDTGTKSLKGFKYMFVAAMAAKAGTVINVRKITDDHGTVIYQDSDNFNYSEEWLSFNLAKPSVVGRALRSALHIAKL
jgi:hypothetical protein